MPRTAATITQADVARVVRAARQAGAAEIEVRPDGTMVIRLSASPPAAPITQEIVDADPIVL